jgi:hypothetical protein
MLVVDNILVDPRVADVYFSCDLSICRGACCFIEGEYGAPLLEDEIEVIEGNLPMIMKYLGDRSIKLIKGSGFFKRTEIGPTTLPIDGRECVFVFWEDGIAKCAIEKAYLNGEIPFRKPISCHLFPLRNYKFNGFPVIGNGDILKYVKIPECRSALEKGKRENVKLYEFLREALIRAFGEDWYARLLDGMKKSNPMEIL